MNDPHPVTRRRAATFLLAACAAPFVAATESGKPVRMLVPFTAGGGTDAVARLLAKHMQPQMDRTIVVDNRPGAAGAIAGDALARSEPDGATIMLVSNSFLTNAAIAKVPYDVRKDFTPIGIVGTSPYFLVVPAGSPLRSLADLVKEARAQPQGLSFGSAGPGSVTHLVGELFKQRAGLRAVHIPYKGNSAALIDLIAGQLQFMFSDIGSAMPHIRSGKLRVLAVTARNRLPTAPDVPTAIEAGVDLDLVGFYGLIGPARLPAPVVERYNTALRAALTHPEVRSQLAAIEVSIDAASLSPAQFAERFVAESDTWRDLVKRSALKFD